MNNAFSKLWTPILIVIRQTMINSITSFCVLKCCQIVSGETSRIKYAAVSNALGEARRKKSKNQMVFIGNKDGWKQCHSIGTAKTVLFKGSMGSQMLTKARGDL